MSNNNSIINDNLQIHKTFKTGISYIKNRKNISKEHYRAVTHEKFEKRKKKLKLELNSTVTNNIIKQKVNNK